ncbi:rod shape-determining protein RodA [Umboniibacter marinipuniceus]|uniref:Peptidoglycan glycosyltransferase MrdB n=1 Tax=Umboniibacter marinipuniceus TaxID=569599 RepID=A0A3M0A4S6_9GAMM|nr:rod shape-determining protein RodA [Umboniibacter marinipuniceus]RMA80043.1 cell elongation-specific peptidoglycan biosynthesis regulator RodA [Umboniibacter marinipuniceus]
MRDFSRQSKTQFESASSWLGRLHIDLPLLLLLLTLTSVGVAVLYSASDQSLATVKRQLSFFAVAYIAMFIVAQFKQETLMRLALPAWIFGVFLLILVEFIGVGAKGAQRWLALPGLPQFQPSEVMKLALPIALGTWLQNRQLPPSFKDLVVAAAIILVPVLLIATQPDLGTSILIAASGLIVILVAGISWKLVFLCIGSLIAAAPVFWFFLLKEYQKTRILTLLDPEADRYGAGWNIIQSKIAIGSGGVDGKGYLSGTQSQLDFLPESHTDFIIAVFAEEWGLTGVLALLTLYLLIIARGLWIGLNAQETFGRMVAAAVTLTFFVYVFVNMGMVSGLLPVVGVPLPLVSQGGTSIVTLMAGFGLLMSISTEKKRLWY